MKTYQEVCEALTLILRNYHDCLVADGFGEAFARELVKGAQPLILEELLNREVER